MIRLIRLLQSIGKFDYVPSGAIELDRHVLVYAENGRGKTTLAAILRSLATGDPLPICERRRLAAANEPHVVVQSSTDPNPFVFENGAWNRSLPDIAIFDDTFVDENVSSGLNVAASHRQNLHEVVIGAQGVALNRQLQSLVEQIEIDNANLRARADAIPANLRRHLSVDDFCALPAALDVDRQITEAEQALAASQQQDRIRTTPDFVGLEVREFNVPAINAILALDLPGLEASAVARVQTHFTELGREGEEWVAEGMRQISDPPHREICPFCTQDLRQSPIIPHYRAYFSQEYSELKANIGRFIQEISNVHSREIPGRIERALRIAGERRAFWSNFCEVPQIELETERLIHSWQLARDGVLAVLSRKQAAPLEQLEIAEDVQAAIQRFTGDMAGVKALNEKLQRANNAVAVVKAHAAGSDSEAASRKLSELKASRSRHSAEVLPLCEAYIAARNAKSNTERQRDETRAALEHYRAAEFPHYEQAINDYLRRFNVGYSIQNVTFADTRGGATCNYTVLINNTPIPVSGAIAVPGQPSFRTTLSSGDRNTLALAFFLASLERNPQLANKIVVVDDPASSLDEHRFLTTVQELRRLARNVAQIIVLSHNKNLLFGVWSKIEPRRSTAIKLEREGDASNIVPWEVSREAVTEHDRNHSLIRSYLRDGPRDNSRAVATALRPVLEAFLRVSQPEHFSTEGDAMRRFRDACHQRVNTDGEILGTRDLTELEDLLEYANLFHHNTNLHYQEVAINDAQLRGFAERVLRFAR